MSLPTVRSPDVREGDMEAAVIERHHPLDNEDAYYLDPFYANVPWLAGMDWLIRFWRYFDSRLSGIRYIIAGCSFYGGILFMIGSFAQAVPKVADNITGTFDAYGWLVIIPFFVGTYVFTTGCFLLSVEAINREYPDEVIAWKAGRRPTKPRFRMLGWEPRNFAWWAGVSYTFGALLYNVSATTSFADLWKSVTISQKGVQWIEIWPFFFGGIFFFTSGLLYLIEFSGNPLRGMIPFLGNTAEDRRTFTWWVNCTNWWGGVGFAMSGFWNWETFNIPVWQYRIENIIGFGIGALMFWTAGLLLYIQMSLARCTSPKVPPAVSPDRGPHTSSFAGHHPDAADGSVTTTGESVSVPGGWIGTSQAQLLKAAR
mmetsp:Transcript_14589/g.44097  ORF Transcript_14589/g.44097 Transcript_14589/m.44097 type:complete len:370 (+) Transcript_14589:270-1379(+)